MSVKDDLIAAKALIETPEKWVQGVWRLNGCYCAMGAVGTVVQAQGWTDWVSRHPSYREVLAALPRGFNHVPTFNDDPRTRHKHVLALFDRAIAAAGEA